ncbi:MAG: hypothetical protein IKP36_00035 [Bacteroidaceae bacterium]|nr:hypothetical protein [Bacteroidaceae bacterium]
MELILTRIAKRKAYTIGRLSIVERIDDEYLAGSKETYFCDTLEPTALELKTTVSKEAVLRSPVKAQLLKPFAIPEGRYAVVITWSPKFKMWLPLLLGGPDFNHLFKGIRIHMGNTAKDTAGCILVGRNQIVGQLLESRKWLYELKQKIVEAKNRGEAVWLTIK